LIFKNCCESIGDKSKKGEAPRQGGNPNSGGEKMLTISFTQLVLLALVTILTLFLIMGFAIAIFKPR